MSSGTKWSVLATCQACYSDLMRGYLDLFPYKLDLRNRKLKALHIINILLMVASQAAINYQKRIDSSQDLFLGGANASGIF